MIMDHLLKWACLHNNKLDQINTFIFVIQWCDYHLLYFVCSTLLKITEQTNLILDYGPKCHSSMTLKPHLLKLYHRHL